MCGVVGLVRHYKGAAPRVGRSMLFPAHQLQPMLTACSSGIYKLLAGHIAKIPLDS